MRLFVDEQEDFPLSQPGLPPIDVLNEVDRALRAQGRAIVRVTADGRDVGPAELAVMAAHSNTAGVGELRLETSSISEMVEASLGEVRGLLPELPLVCHGLAAAFGAQGADEATEQFHQLVEIWNAICERRQLVLSALEQDAASIICEGKTFAAHETAVQSHLAAAAAAVKLGDKAKAQDLLEYELAPLAESEERLFAMLASLNTSQ